MRDRLRQRGNPPTREADPRPGVQLPVEVLELILAREQTRSARRPTRETASAPRPARAAARPVARGALEQTQPVSRSGGREHAPGAVDHSRDACMRQLAVDQAERCGGTANQHREITRPHRLGDHSARRRCGGRCSISARALSSSATMSAARSLATCSRVVWAEAYPVLVSCHRRLRGGRRPGFAATPRSARRGGVGGWCAGVGADGRGRRSLGARACRRRTGRRSASIRVWSLRRLVLQRRPGGGGRGRRRGRRGRPPHGTRRSPAWGRRASTSATESACERTADDLPLHRVGALEFIDQHDPVARAQACDGRAVAGGTPSSVSRRRTSRSS